MKFIKTDSVLSKALSLLTAVMMMVSSFGVSFVAAPSEANALAFPSWPGGNSSEGGDIPSGIIKGFIKGFIEDAKNSEVCLTENHDLQITLDDRTKTVELSKLLEGVPSNYQDKVIDVLESMYDFCESEESGEPAGNATVYATKVVCDNPSLIPDWERGRGNATANTITSTTAQNFVEQTEGCRIEAWDFEGRWKANGETSGWTTFSSTESSPAQYEVNLSDLAGDGNGYVNIREVEQDGYIPFGGTSVRKIGNGVESAALYCHQDRLYFDNSERILTPQIEAGGEYHCVAFNANKPVETTEPETVTSYLDLCTEADVKVELEKNWDDRTSGIITDLTGNFKVEPVNDSAHNGYKVSLLAKSDKSWQGVKGTITLPASATGIGVVHVTEGPDKLETPDTMTGGAYHHDIAQIKSGETHVIEFQLAVDSANDVFYIDFVKNCEGSSTQTATVQMCKMDHSTENLLSDWELNLTSAEPIDTVIVAPNGTAVQSQVLDAGTYLLKASGTYTYRPTKLQADAAFSHRKASDNLPGQGSDGLWHLSSSSTSKYLGLQVDNDGATGWGNIFNPAHEYSHVVTLSSDRAIDFLITDNNYKDNSGTLKVEVYRVFSDVTGESGCASIEDVPFGQYEVGEVMQSGWQNVLGLGKVEVNEEEHTFTVENQKIEEDNPSITINATKVVCKAEEFLPNWAGNNNAKNIDQTKVSNFLSDVNKDTSEDNKNCWTKNWEFQWASGTIAPTEPGGYVGYLDDEKWTTISTGTTTIPLASLESEAISVREVLQEGYIPFTYDESNRDNENDVTAELYCSGDGLNYDNLEWVRDLKDGDTVECVAFNAPLPNEGGGGPSNDGGFTTSSRTRTGGFVPTSTVGEILGDSTSIHEGEVLGAADSFPGMPDSGNESQNLIGLIMALQVLLMTAGAFYMKRRMTFWQS